MFQFVWSFIRPSPIIVSFTPSIEIWLMWLCLLRIPSQKFMLMLVMLVLRTVSVMAGATLQQLYSQFAGITELFAHCYYPLLLNTVVIFFKSIHFAFVWADFFSKSTQLLDTLWLWQYLKSVCESFDWLYAMWMDDFCGNGCCGQRDQYTNTLDIDQACTSLIT